MMTPEELQLLAQLRSKLQQAEMALSDTNNNTELTVTNRDVKEALLIDLCLVGEPLSDALELLSKLESIDVIVSEQTTTLLATIGAATPKPPEQQG